MNATATAEPSVRTEFAFTLPVGYLDDSGALHREGRMRLATARDEILPLRDPRVQDNEAYLTVILLSRVITSLGTLSAINPGVVEGMFAADLAFLQDLYPAGQRRRTQPRRRQLPRMRPRVRRRLLGGSAGPPGGILTYGTQHLLEEVSYVAYH